MRMLAIDSLSANTLLCLGWARMAQSRLPEAERAFRRALEIDPQQAYARPNLAHLLLETGRTQEVLSLYRQIERESQSQAAHHCSARDGPPMAPSGVPILLEVEEPSSGGHVSLVKFGASSGGWPSRTRSADIASIFLAESL
jgi:tetratricopeptide (TPR) repeat protein